jgi:hypothetical protein
MEVGDLARALVRELSTIQSIIGKLSDPRLFTFLHISHLLLCTSGGSIGGIMLLR